MYESIVIDAYWFSEGEFWNISVRGYITDEDPEILDDSETLSADFGPKDVMVELELMAKMWILKAQRVELYMNVHESKTVTH